MGISESNPSVIALGISDHLGWNENTREHLYLLQEKINSYICFIESGEVENRFPQGDKIPKVIEIYFQNPPPEEAYLFLHEVEKILAGLNFFYK